MHKYRILKFFFLATLYAAVIIGVFILQFKTETIIAQNIGGMDLSLSSSKDKDNNDILKNRFRISYEGLVFSSSDDTSAVAQISGHEGKEPLILESWSKSSGNEIKLNFKDGPSVSFVSHKSSSGDSESEKASSSPLLTITAELPENYESISIPYTIDAAYTVSQGTNQGTNKEDSQSLTLQKAEEYFKISGPAFASASASGFITFGKTSPVASFASFVPIREFQFESVSALALSDENTYNSNKAAFKNAVRNKFQSAVDAKDNLSEKGVVAYIADMAESSKFNMALNSVPSTFKSSSKRTYLSSPYLANMIPLNKGLRAKTAEFSAAINSAIKTKDANLFTMEGLADYLLIHKFDSNIKEALAIPGKIDESKLSLRQAESIINVYVSLDEQDANFADNLGSSIEKCLGVIRKHLTLDGDRIVVGKRADAESSDSDGAMQSDEKELSRTEKILLGQTLRDYGDNIGDTAIMETGNMLVNQELQYLSAMSLDELGEIYHRFVRENRFYPHVQILGYYGTKAAWAWTCAPNIDYKVASNGTTDINIDFTLSYTHYVTFTGIPTFHMNIEIQKLQFRSDRNFEIYNSSGFVYDEDIKTFYLKSRHKSKIELIRLFCDPAQNFTSATHPAK